MTQFLDVRLNPVGGELATAVSVCEGTEISNYTGALLADLQAMAAGRHVLIATHGFNVDRQAGIACLSNWDSILQLPQASCFVGLLWPGDSIWAHGLDYPDEPKVADEAGKLLGPFIDQTFAAAASVSFASHSLGARVVLETVSQMNLPVREVILMAGAIDDNCLISEYQKTAESIGRISILASRKDTILSMLFPLGNFFGGILASGHPWVRAALGHTGPASDAPSNFVSPFQIPDNWNFNHGNYLQVTQPPAPRLTIPTEVPPNGSSVFPIDCDAAGNPIAGWQEAFSAAFASTRFRN